MPNNKQRTIYATLFEIYVPTYTNTDGNREKHYEKSDYAFYGQFKTFGGKESIVNGAYMVYETATIRSPYHSKVKNNVVLHKVNDDTYWDIINVENIGDLNKELSIKVIHREGLS